MVKLPASRTVILGIFLVLPLLGHAQKVGSRVVHKSGHLWKASMQLPVFTHPSPVQKFAMDEFRKEAESGLKSFQKESDGERKDTDPVIDEFTYDTTVTLTYASKDIVSGYTDYEEYLGGAHGSTGYSARIFAMRNGKPAEFRAHDIFVSKSIAKKIAHKYVAVPIVKKRGGMDDVFANEVPANDLGSIVITPKGIMWIIPPYDMDSYAAGTYLETAPWSALTNAVKWTGPTKPFSKLAAKKR